MRNAGTQDTIDVYTLPWCPHCSRAKALLTRRELRYREVDGSGQDNFRARLLQLTGGTTVPRRSAFERIQIKLDHAGRVIETYEIPKES